MPNDHFLRSVLANLGYWDGLVHPFRDPGYAELEYEFPNIVRATEIGLTFPATRAKAGVLVTHCFDLVELGHLWDLWLPHLRRAIEVPEIELGLKGQLINQLGYFLMHRRDLEAASNAHRTAIALGEQVRDLMIIGDGWFGLANIGYHQHDYAQAVSFGEQAADIFLELQKPKHLSNAYNVLGLLAHATGNYPIALNYFSQAVDLRRQTESPLRLAMFLQNQAFTEQSTGQNEAALVTLAEAETILQANHNPGQLVNLRLTLGAIHFAMGAYATAEEVFKKIDTGFLRRNNMRTWLAMVYNNLGNVYLKQGLRDEAETSLLQAAAHWRKTAEEIQLANTLGDLAEAQALQGRVKEAMPNYDEALIH